MANSQYQKHKATSHTKNNCFGGKTMINMAEAKARENGIDFFANKKNITISATRNEEGEVIVTRMNTIKSNERWNLKIRLIALFWTIVYMAINNTILLNCGTKIHILMFVILMWGIIITHYLIRTTNKKNVQIFKYHAAEHKVLNYWDEYEKTTLDCNEIMKMSSISIRCGSTITAVILILITLAVPGLLFIPYIILKIMWVLISVVITFYLWAYGKCNFLQRLVIREPGIEEVEVAVKGMWEYVSTQTEE